MKDQNSVDGAVGFTQCPIAPGRSFTYNFTIGAEEHGTFWWHSHSDVQRADGLWGGLIVHSPDEIDLQREEYLLMVGDWFHQNQTEVLRWYADASSRGNEPVPDSLLVNGQGRFNCSMAVPARPVACSQVQFSDLKPLMMSRSQKKARLRVVNTGSVAGLSLRVGGAIIRPVRVDGGFAVKAEATETVGILYPGERVDLEVEWKGNHAGDHRLTVYLDDECVTICFTIGRDGRLTSLAETLAIPTQHLTQPKASQCSAQAQRNHPMNLFLSLWNKMRSKSLTRIISKPQRRYRTSQQRQNRLSCFTLRLRSWRTWTMHQSDSSIIHPGRHKLHLYWLKTGLHGTRTNSSHLSGYQTANRRESTSSSTTWMMVRIRFIFMDIHSTFYHHTEIQVVGAGAVIIRTQTRRHRTA